MPTPVDPDEVRHVARLARIDLADEDIDRYAHQFADILEYFETLDEVPETTDTPDLVNVFRDDTPRPSIPHEDALRNAPETEDGYIKAPRVG